MAHLPLLPFQRLILEQVMEEDALCIVARGLGLLRVVAELSRICATRKALVFLLNTTDEDKAELQHQLMQMRSGEGDMAAELLLINSEKNAQARAQMYRQGGLIAVTSQVLILDLLNDVVPFELVTGTLVCNASRVTGESTEAFILRLLRKKAQQAFIKAFSDVPEAFTLGFAPLEKTLKALGLRHVHLWPRFHVSVQKDLSEVQTPVVEFRQPQTRSMEELQQAVLECLRASIAELSAATHAIDAETVNVESSLFRYFDALVKRQLAPVWHRLSGRVRGLAGDLASLRRVAEYVTQYDCVSLQRYLDALLMASALPGRTGQTGRAPMWLESDAANVLYAVNRARLFRKKQQQPEEIRGRLRDLGLPETIEPVLEVPPKWELLGRVLDEIGTAQPSGPVLVMAGAQRTCRLLRSYLGRLQAQVELGDSRHPQMLVEMLRGFFVWKSRTGTANVAEAPAVRGNQPAAKRRRVRGGAASQVSRVPAGSLERETLALAASAASNDKPALELGAEPEEDEYQDDEEWEFDEHYGVVDGQAVMVQTYGQRDMLELVRPSHVVMFDPDAGFVRELEVFQAHHPGVLQQVSFMVYNDSIEEQRYLSALRREKDAFEQLIHEKSVLVIPITAPATPSNSLLMALASHRHAITEPPRIVVDAREFRSPLPSLLHAAGYNVVPRTLEIGDYVLHDDLVVERKSLPDLVSSLRSGRLANQAEAMVKHYRVAALLVEFEVNTSFSLTAIGGLTAGISVGAVSSQLAMLALAFPRLRVLWSSSPYETVEIIGELKRGHAQPDIDRAVSISDQAVVTEHAEFNQQAIGVLQTLPGVTLKNYQAVAARFRSMRDLCAANKEQLAEVVEGAEELYEFLHQKS
ncbi:DNA repair protein RAD16 [Linderina pennispora]|nr:DNA repair protein RAD16 [Linderina pennispora]